MSPLKLINFQNQSINYVRDNIKCEKNYTQVIHCFTPYLKFLECIQNR